MRSLLTPLQYDHTGRLATTDDPARILEQQVIDMLVTYRGERLMRPGHGADLLSFIFSPARSDLMGFKADEVRQYLNANIPFGRIVRVEMTNVVGMDSTVRLTVFYQILQSDPVLSFTQTITGMVTEETIL